MSSAEKTRIAQALPDLAGLLPRSQGVVARIMHKGESYVFPMTKADRLNCGDMKIDVAYRPDTWKVLAIQPLDTAVFGTVGGKVEQGQTPKQAIITEAYEEFTDLTSNPDLVQALGNLQFVIAPAINVKVFQWSENGIARIRGLFGLIIFYMLLNQEQFEALKPHGLTPIHSVPIQQQRSYLPYMMSTI